MISRRTFFRRTAIALPSIAGLGIGYGFWEAAHVRVVQQSVPIPHLPPAFVGKTIAVLTDLHHGPYVGLEYIREVVTLTNSLSPDLIALVGDFAHKGYSAQEQLPPCLNALSALKAPLGVFAVPGNHDMPEGGRLFRKTIAKTSITDLTNQRRRISLGDEHLHVVGVDDLWWGHPDKDPALQDVPSKSAIVMLSHNPDYAEDAPDGRVGLILSGHTHGGQIYFRGLGAGWLPSKYGSKYRCGLVQGPASKVFISRGLGEAGVPLRIGVPPEINLLTMTAEG